MSIAKQVRPSARGGGNYRRQPSLPGARPVDCRIDGPRVRLAGYRQPRFVAGSRELRAGRSGASRVENRLSRGNCLSPRIHHRSTRQTTCRTAGKKWIWTISAGTAAAGCDQCGRMIWPRSESTLPKTTCHPIPTRELRCCAFAEKRDRNSSESNAFSQSRERRQRVAIGRRLRRPMEPRTWENRKPRERRKNRKSMNLSPRTGLGTNFTTHTVGLRGRGAHGYLRPSLPRLRERRPVREIAQNLNARNHGSWYCSRKKNTKIPCSRVGPGSDYENTEWEDFAEVSYCSGSVLADR